MEARSPVYVGTVFPTHLGDIIRQHSWYEIFEAIVWLIIYWNVWRCLVSHGPGPTLRQVWEGKKTLGDGPEDCVKGTTAVN